jgi:hypothetical protein
MGNYLLKEKPLFTMYLTTIIFSILIIIPTWNWRWNPAWTHDILNYSGIIIALMTAFFTLRIKYIELKIKKEDLVKKRKKPKIKKHKKKK